MGKLMAGGSVPSVPSVVKNQITTEGTEGTEELPNAWFFPLDEMPGSCTARGRCRRTVRFRSRIGRCQARDAISRDRICIVQSLLVLLDPIDFTEELMGAEELVTAARTLRRCVLIQPPAIRSDTTADADVDVAVAVDVLTSEPDVERARVTHFTTA